MDNLRNSEIDRIFDEELPDYVLSEGESDASELEDNAFDLGLENISDTEVEDESSSTRPATPARPIPHSTGNIYVSKGKHPREYVSYPQHCHRRRTQNIVRERPGVKPNGRADNAKDIFTKFFTPQILNTIVIHSNEEADKKGIDHIDGTELLAYIGLLVLMGANKDSKVDYHELWSELYGRPVYSAVMSRNRFKDISKILRFDDKSTRVERRAVDKLAPIRETFDDINSIFPTLFSAGPNTTVDEMLSLFRGRCPFKVFMKEKPGKYGILIRMLCDAESRYVLSMEVYSGRTDIEKGCKALVCRLVEPIANSGRNVTTDRFYTSVDLAETLYNDFKLTLVGTMQKNRKKIPDVLKDVGNRPLHSSMFAFTDSRSGQPPVTLVSYIVKEKPKRNLIMLSTQHEDDEVSADEKNKPHMVLFYNSTKGGVDSVDQMARNYSVKRGTRRWPLTVFFTLIDIVCINSFTLFIGNCPQWKCNDKNRRLMFLRKLALELIKPQVEIRGNNITGLNKTVVSAMESVLEKKLEYSSVEQPLPDPQELKRGRCHMCVREASSKQVKYDRLGKSKVYCSNCHKHVCGKHSMKTVVCKKCKDGLESGSE